MTFNDRVSAWTEAELGVAGRVRDVVRTLEWSRLEKDVVSVKMYAPHLGIVREMDVAGGNESFQLVSVRRP